MGSLVEIVLGYHEHPPHNWKDGEKCGQGSIVVSIRIDPRGTQSRQGDAGLLFNEGKCTALFSAAQTREGSPGTGLMRHYLSVLLTASRPAWVSWLRT